MKSVFFLQNDCPNRFCFQWPKHNVKEAMERLVKKDIPQKGNSPDPVVLLAEKRWKKDVLSGRSTLVKHSQLGIHPSSYRVIWTNSLMWHRRRERNNLHHDRKPHLNLEIVLDQQCPKSKSMFIKSIGDSKRSRWGSNKPASLLIDRQFGFLWSENRRRLLLCIDC